MDQRVGVAIVNVQVLQKGCKAISEAKRILIKWQRFV